jgi:hypothetical protein
MVRWQGPEDLSGRQAAACPFTNAAGYGTTNARNSANGGRDLYVTVVRGPRRPEGEGQYREDSKRRVIETRYAPPQLRLMISACSMPTPLGILALRRRRGCAGLLSLVLSGLACARQRRAQARAEVLFVEGVALVQVG